jgi:Uma2 family endonuclease
MTVLTPHPTLEEFLQSPDLDASPAWEYRDGERVQKPMPKFRHALLQKLLLSTLQDPNDRYLTLPELRCTFAERSIVPDIVVIAFDNLRLNDRGEPEDNFLP